MIKYRIQYSKTAAARFTSHLDVLRAISRTLRRAGLPVAFSAGFNPAPRLSFGPPLPLGLESEAEYFDLELIADLTEEALFLALNTALPPGLKVIKVQKLVGKTRSLMAGIKALSYQFLLIPRTKLDQAQVESLLEQLWQNRITGRRPKWRASSRYPAVVAGLSLGFWAQGMINH